MTRPSLREVLLGLGDQRPHAAGHKSRGSCAARASRPLSPKQLRQGVQPDARPVAVEETDLLAILRNLTDTVPAAAAEVLAPEQLAVSA